MKILKWIIVSLLYLNLLFSVFGFNEKKTYCDGWSDGYILGYCGNDLFCIEPVVPICPLPSVGLDEYKHGLLKGVKAGKKKRDE